MDASSSSGAGSSMQSFGSGFSAMAAWQAGKANKKISEYNAKIADMKAKFAIQNGEAAAYRHDLQVHQLIGQQRVGFASQNVSLDDGSALEVQSDTAKWGMVDSITIRNNAAMEAWGYQLEATSDRINGSLADAAGRNAAISGIISGLASSGKSSYQGSQ